MRDSKLASYTYSRICSLRAGAVYSIIYALALAQISCFFSLLNAGPLKAWGPIGHGLVAICLNPALMSVTLSAIDLRDDTVHIARADAWVQAISGVCD